MFRRTLIPVVILFAFSLQAQVKRADRKFKDGNYLEAAELYEEAIIGKDSMTVTAYENLAASYRVLRNYKQAADQYQKVITMKDHQPISRFYYAEMLRALGKTDEAKVQYDLYAKEAPEDKQVKLSLRSLREVGMVLQQPEMFRLIKCEGINSLREEYAPTIYNSGVLFVSNRSNDLVNFETSSNSYYDLYFSKLKLDSDSVKVFDNPELFSSKINSFYHDGPASLNATQTLICFARVSEKKSRENDFVHRAKLFFATKEDGKWSKPMPFPYNSDEYSSGHPALSPAGDTLYFASDMPGGFGGKDIYFSLKQNGSWSKPQNMGPVVNSPANELFPYLRSDGVFFFASDGYAGLGALDIYMCEKENGKFLKPYNLGAPINSPKDDFGIVYDNMNKQGYFSSNRDSETKDDIYAFESSGTFIALEGKVLLSRDTSNPLRNTEVLLFKSDGTLMQVTTTDKFGSFSFRNLPADAKYLVQLNENDPGLAGYNKFFVTDKDDRIVATTELSKDSKHFLFKNLPPDLRKMPYLPDEDRSIFEGRLFVDNDKDSPVANQKLILFDSEGKAIDSTFTDDKGNFVFRALPADRKYSLGLAKTEDSGFAGKAITLADRNDKVIAVLSEPKEGFEFSVLPKDMRLMSTAEANDVGLVGYLTKGDRDGESIANAQVGVYDEYGKLLGIATTDENGKFNFKSLPADKNYTIKIFNVDDVELAGKPIVVQSSTGDVIAAVQKGDNGFEYRMLPSEKGKMVTETIADVALSGMLFGGVYGEQAIAETQVGLYDEKGRLIETATTDKYGKFVFKSLPPDNNYSIRVLGVEDAGLAANPIVLKTEDGEVVKIAQPSANGFDFKILPTDDKKISYTPAEDISVLGTFLYGDKDEKPLSGTKVGLYDKNGKLIATTTTDAFGNFEFKELPKDKSYSIRVLDEDDPRLAGTIITLKGQSGEVVASSKVTKGRSFEYKLLASDRKSMSLLAASDTKLGKGVKIIQGRVLDEDKNPIDNLSVKLVSIAGKVLSETITAEDGKFTFKGNYKQKNYLFEIDENDARLKDVGRVFITDNRGQALGEVCKDASGRFCYKVLPTERKLLVSANVQDPSLAVVRDYKRVKSLKNEGEKAVVVEHIHYPPDEVEILGKENNEIMKEIIKIMSRNKALRLEIRSFTDARQSNEYNQRLSDRRARFAVEYLTSRGIGSFRVTGLGLGETQLVNNCHDGVECPESKHAENRRTEFHFTIKK